jgi:hypothetical protein
MKYFCRKLEPVIPCHGRHVSLAVWILWIALCITACRTLPDPKPHPQDMTTAGLLNEAAEQMADDLDLKVGLYGKKILLSENNFWQRNTGINLPFSAVLRDAMAAALSGRGATITLQDSGVEKWRLEGTYGTEGTDLVITLKAVRTKVSAAGAISVDAAATRGRVSVNTLEQKWFRQEFSRVARTLMRMLDKNYSGGGEMKVTVCRLEPGLPGQPSLYLGPEFRKFLETAVMDSPIFVTSAIGGWGAKVQMKGTYTRVGDLMRFHVAVIDSKERTLTSAVFDVDIHNIPSDLLEPVADTEIKICAAYTPSSPEDLPPGMSVSASLLEHVMDALAEYNLKARVCTSGEAYDVKVEARIKVREKTTPDGFRVASVTVHLKPVGSDNKILGTVKRTGRKVFSHDLENALEKILQKIFQEKQVGKQLAVMILGR